MDLSKIDLESIYSWFMSNAIGFLGSLLLSLITIVVGRMIIKKIIKVTKKRIDNQNFEPTKTNFILSLIKIGLNVILYIIAAGIVGISTASLVALLGAAGLAIGLALQGSLSNVAGGFLILILKPFKEGDWIEAQGISGTVYRVNILNTILKTGDNKTIYIPNSAMSNGNVINYTEEAERRLDLTFGIGYDDDIDKAKLVLNKILENDDRIIKDRPNRISVANLGDSSVDFTFRVWCKTEHYWDLYFDIIEKAKKEFDLNNISIPYPQRDIHLFNK